MKETYIVPLEVYRRHTYKQAGEVAKVTPLSAADVSYYWWIKLYYPDRLISEINVYALSMLESQASEPPAPPRMRGAKDSGND